MDNIFGEKLFNRYQSITESTPSGVTSKKVTSEKQSNKPTLMHGGILMNFTQILESLDDVIDAVENQSIESQPVPNDISNSNNDDLVEELNRIFTPILIKQGFEGNIADQVNESMSEAGSNFLEQNIIKFDDQTRMAQLISVCAKLLQRKKNTEKYRTYVKAAQIKKQMAIEMEKEEYDNAKILAQQYLVKVSTTNNSSVARDAANKLLPETNH